LYTSLLRDEPLVPIVHRLLGHFYGYLQCVEDALLAGRGRRGRAARTTRAAIGHALAFTTWRSLTQEHGLRNREAVALMSLLVEGAAATTIRSQTAVTRSHQGRTDGQNPAKRDYQRGA